MFILPDRRHKSEITYNPFIAVDEKQYQSKGSVTKQALFFMREILQSASLTSEEAFSTDCIQLLNLINVLCPTRIVTIFKTRNKNKLQELNLKEYLRVLKSLKYSTYGFPKRKYLQSNQGAQKQMALTVLHLKLQYKKKGIKYQKKDEVLRYYIDHYSIPSKKKKILGINPFFTTKSTINTISLTKSCRTKNIFYSNQRDKEKFLIKRANELGEKLSNRLSSESGSEDDYQNKKSNNKNKKKGKKKKNLNRKINKEDDSDDDSNGNNNEPTSEESESSSDDFEFDSPSSESEDFNQQNSSSSGEVNKGIKKRNKNNKNYHNKTTSDSQEFEGTQSSENSTLDNYPKKKKKKEPKRSYTYSGNYFGFPSSDFNTDETSEDDSSSYSNDDSGSSDNSNSNSKDNSNSNPDSNDNSNLNSDDNNSNNSNSDSFSTYHSNSSSNSGGEFYSIDNQKKEKNKATNRNVKKKNKYKTKISRTHKQSKTNKVRRINKTINNPQKPKTDQTRRKSKSKNQNKTKNPNKNTNKNKNKNKNPNNSNNTNTKSPKKGGKKKIDKYQIRQTLDRSAINPLPHRSNTFVEHNTNENNIQPKFKLEKNESLYSIISFPIDVSNIYIRKELSELFKGKNKSKENKKTRNKNQKQTVYIKNPKRRSYMHLIFHILNTIHEWDNNDQKKSNRFSERCGFGYLESICNQGYLEAVALGKNGKALFSTSFASKKSKHFSAGTLELNEKKLILSFNHIKTPVLSENYTQKTFQISLNKQDLCKICIKHLLSSNAEYVLDFENEAKAICALITLLYFFHVSFTTGLNKKTKTKGIGYNPIRREEKHILDLVDTVMPPLKSPNEKFTKLLSNTDLENLTKGAKRVMEKYYAQGGVNFLITLVNKSEFPLTAGFLKIRPNYIKIGMKNTIFKKVPFSANPRMLKNRTNNALFRMDWAIKSTCSTSATKPSVTIVCSSTTERSLITKAITYFFNQYKAKNNKM
ncbi:hypothetical protein M0812_16181 [Anaeramoeba flamelloides]|uniref:Uncharacterized protein n=1 Tax=Anaeramoeba flamelloides TaxID=1746091 RepID=A0AAV7ZEH2_9EUKA|nr:hypothetical protein M0812_16181 [Anaeramoeba flamelloides]